MITNYNGVSIAARVWFLTSLILTLAVGVYFLCFKEANSYSAIGLVFLASLFGSFPVFIVLLLVVPFINRLKISWEAKTARLMVSCLLLTTPYGLLAAAAGGLFETVHDTSSFLISIIKVMALLFGCSLLAITFIMRICYSYFNHNLYCSLPLTTIITAFISSNKNTTTMETYPGTAPVAQSSNSNLIKGLITGGLILIMLIPTLFISELVKEREARQKEVVKEVSSKWASAQTLSAPFIVVPYNIPFVNEEGKNMIRKTELVLLANDLAVNGSILPEERKRSIYEVLLYRSKITMGGSFQVKIPSDIRQENIDFSGAKICLALSDFKGIEEEIVVNFGGQNVQLAPGLPVKDFGSIGLSAPITLTAATAAAKLPFALQVKLKGSEQLHFRPMSGSSRFALQSAWPSPSFDGDMLPAEHNISDSGFAAKWSFNQANLPYAMVFQTNTVQDGHMEFGVSLVQPADHYNKTMRSVKYAILFIGLTFALFFIIELMQKKPFHPVQYTLVGLALVIFYALLLSISEYLAFDLAYGIAAMATVALISLYAQSHFKSWKTAATFFFFLACLYSFIFVLIRLEDTALLVGSIGLFLVLAMVMFASRRINWYGNGRTQLVTTADL